MVSGRSLTLLVLLGALALPAAAPARSVFDPDIGWPAALRAKYAIPHLGTHPCRRDITRADIHRQSLIDKRGDPSEGLRRIFHYRWGAGWFDFCDAGRLHIGVVASEAAGIPVARALIARRHLTRYIRFVAVRSTWRELSDVQTEFEQRWPELEDQSLVEDSSDPERNAVRIDLAKPVTPDVRAAIRAWALRAPVNVVVHDTDAPDYRAVLV
jgi:hypothetical protein